MRTPQRSFIDDSRNAIEFASDVADYYASASPPFTSKTFAFTSSSGIRQLSFGAKSLAAFSKLAEEGGVSFIRLKTELAALDEILQAAGEVPEIAENCKKQYEGSKHVKLLGIVSARAVERLKLADALFEANREEVVATQEEVGKIEDSIKEAERKVESEKEKRNAVLFMAWVPSLTVRVGAVVLLLFLTQVLLATYRFTMSLSTFYDGIGDAIQMLQPGASRDKWYQVEHLQLLSQMLIPGTVRIDPVADPSQHLTELAKTWIARGGK